MSSIRHHCQSNICMQVSKRALPGCDKACCGGVVPGGFVKDKADPAAMHYRAAKTAGCKYVNYRRHEVRSRSIITSEASAVPVSL